MTDPLDRLAGRGPRDPARPAPSAERSIRGYLLASACVMLLLVGGVGGIAAATHMAGAVIAQGVFVVDSYVKRVQHPTGGVVGSLAVRDGDKVEANDLLIRLDDTQTRANHAIVSGRLDQLLARQARLAAERDDVAAVAFPAALTERRADAGVAALMAGELRLFELRRSARAGQKEQLASRIGQLGKEAGGLALQEQAKETEIKLIEEEKAGVQSLWRKNLVPIQRVTALQRDAARLNGERGQLVAGQAQIEGKVAETRLQILQIDQEMRSEVAKDMRETESQIAELSERKLAAEDQLRRVDIRAPQAGVIHQLAVHTIGGVVSPGDTIMLIVPVSDVLRVEARIAPQDIDQVQPGQVTVMRLSAFNQRVTPELQGKVAEVSPDLIQDQKTGLSYYTARIDIPPAELAKLGDLKIIPGMPAEAFIQTSSRTMLSYLVKPLQDQIERAFRED